MDHAVLLTSLSCQICIFCQFITFVTICSLTLSFRVWNQPVSQIFHTTDCFFCSGLLSQTSSTSFNGFCFQFFLVIFSVMVLSGRLSWLPVSSDSTLMYVVCQLYHTVLCACFHLLSTFNDQSCPSIGADFIGPEGSNPQYFGHGIMQWTGPHREKLVSWFSGQSLKSLPPDVRF